MKLLPLRSLRSQLAFKQTLTFALLALLLTWSAYALLSRRIYDQVDNELQDRGIAVRSMLQIRDGKIKWLNSEADPEVREQFEHSVRYYELFEESGARLESSADLSTLQSALTPTAKQSLQSGRVGWEIIDPGDGARIRIMDAPVLGLAGHHYLLRIGSSLADADEACHRLQLIFGTAFLFVVLAHWMNSWLIAGKALKRLEEISNCARQVTAFDQSTCLPVFGTGDELDQLTVSLNGMIVRMRGSFQRMTEFLRNLSHEVRQPLTVLRSETEQALRQGCEHTEFREMLSKQLEHVEMLARTVTDLIELAQSDHDQIKLNRQTEDLSELVQAAVDGMRAQAGERDIQLSATLQSYVMAAVDTGQLWRLLLNLLDNAIKFNHPGGRIEVTLTGNRDISVISITDTGCGIAFDEKDHIFERGYRTAAARKSSVPGTGLGLHFAKCIAEAHGGRVEVAPAPGGGSCFRVTLPLLSGPGVSSKVPVLGANAPIN